MNSDQTKSSFAHEFNIGGRRVGPCSPVLVIAEAGVSHFGSLGKALQLVNLAADAGAEVFKTQVFDTDRLVSSRLPEWRERLRSKEVGIEFIMQMKARCDERGLIFLCTAHDEKTLPWLDELEVPAFKIGSGERSNVPFFAEIARRGKPVILSTGMYSTEHVREALNVLGANGCREVALLHCVTSYPTPYDQVNLRAMDELREIFDGPVGYSDHTRGHHVVLAAVARGASIVEKHITLDFDVPNAQDWQVSCGPDDFADFVRTIREVEQALGRSEKVAQACEVPAFRWALKSLVAACPLKAGSQLETGMLIAKRPGDGIAPSHLAAMLGRTLNRDLAEDEPIAWGDLQ